MRFKRLYERGREVIKCQTFRTIGAIWQFSVIGTQFTDITIQLSGVLREFGSTLRQFAVSLPENRILNDRRTNEIRRSEWGETIVIVKKRVLPIQVWN